MLILITYDVNTTSASGRRRLNKIAKLCCNYGQRVQNSVFECAVDYAKYLFLKNELLDLYDSEEDSIRIYNLGNNYSKKIEHFGIKESYDPEGILLL
ncbi:MAG: CRISPR-associated endonuclease Cas2 [Succiniclasticum sp.]|nr:CRISPR-associated endonuclease Cas2 [Succiniclasticum sp.]